MAKRNYLSVILKGIGMGTADVIPGVSGGTIAFITGIYEELLDSIKSIDLTAVKLLFTLRLKEFWKKINGNFLLSLIAGIALAAFTLAKLMTWLLENHSIPVWAFFFGLIAASTVIVSKRVPKWSSTNILALALGAAAHGIGTARAIEIGAVEGALSGLAMALMGLATALLMPLMERYLY